MVKMAKGMEWLLLLEEISFTQKHVSMERNNRSTVQKIEKKFTDGLKMGKVILLCLSGTLEVPSAQLHVS